MAQISGSIVELRFINISILSRCARSASVELGRTRGALGFWLGRTFCCFCKVGAAKDGVTSPISSGISVIAPPVNAATEADRRGPRRGKKCIEERGSRDAASRRKPAACR